MCRRRSGLQGVIYFSTPVMTTPRMNARWPMRKMIIGMSMATVSYTHLTLPTN
jgi:hypothetical protein